MSIRPLSIKSIIKKKSRHENVNSTYWQHNDFLPEKWQQQKTPNASGSNDRQCPTTDSPSALYASEDHKEDSVQQNSNWLSGTLQTLNSTLVWNPNRAKLKKYTIHCTAVYSNQTLYYYLSTIQTLSVVIISKFQCN